LIKSEQNDSAASYDKVSTFSGLIYLIHLWTRACYLLWTF